MQSNKGRANTLPEDRDDPHEKVKNLQEKLDQAVTKISELTDVLKHLDKDFTTEKYYDESAKVTADAQNKGRPLGAAAAGQGSQSYGGSVSQVGRGGPRSDMPTNSQVTNSMRTTKKR